MSRGNGFTLKNYASTTLERIRDECRKNEVNEAYQTSYKPLLLESSQNYSKNIHKTRILSFNPHKSKSKTDRTSPQFCLTQSMEISQANKKNFHRSMKLSNSSGFFLTNNWCKEDSDEQKIQKFVSELYVAKTKDLKIHRNTRQQKIFVQKLKHSINSTTFDTPQCDFGLFSMGKICKFLTHFKRVEVLNLDRNPIGDKGAIKLASLLSSLSLKTLSIMSANISPRGGVVLLQSLIGLQGLQNLILSSPDGFNRNRLGQQSFAILPDILSHPKCGIKNIQLANVGLGEAGLLSMCTGFKKAQRLVIENLNLASNQIKVAQDNLKYVQTCFERLPLVRLEMQQNQLGDQGGELFGYVLGFCYGRSVISTKLDYIDLSFNQIKTKGIEALFSSLSNNKKMSELYLNDNKASEDTNFYQIKSFLSHNWTLKKLHLKGSITQNGDLKFIAQGLNKNKSLSYLDLSNNHFQIDSITDLFTQIKQNHFLKSLKLENCNISNLYMQKIEPLLFENSSLTSLCLANNYITDKGAEILLHILMHRHIITDVNLHKNCISLHLLENIASQLKENRIISSMKEDPEIEYLNYAQKMQESQKKKLELRIEQLESKNIYYNKKHCLENIFIKENQIKELESQVEKEERTVRDLEQKLKSPSQIIGDNNH